MPTYTGGNSSFQSDPLYRNTSDSTIPTEWHPMGGGGSTVNLPSGTGSNAPSIDLNQFNTSSSIRGTIGGSGILAPPLPRDAPPAPADLGRLTNLADHVQRKKAIQRAMDSYDELSAATQSEGFQSASNAGTTYANRLEQQGINPVASGVVAAQARLPVYKALAEIGTDKEKTRLDAVSRADTLAASIASTIAGLQQAHAKTLADFNVQQTGYQLDLSKFNASQRSGQEELAAKTALGYAGLSASGGGSGGRGGNSGGAPSDLTGDPYNVGYIPNMGPIIPSTGWMGANGHNVRV